METRIGVYFGRFNPPHIGHMAQILACLKTVDKLFVVVCCAEHKNEKDNPFSGAERVKMLRVYAKEQGIGASRIKVASVNEYHSDKEAIDNLFAVCKNPSVIFVNDTKTQLAKTASKIVRITRLPLKKRIGCISATKLRDAIASGEKWEKMTGKSVVRLIKKFDGVERIKECYTKG